MNKSRYCNEQKIKQYLPVIGTIETKTFCMCYNKQQFA